MASKAGIPNQKESKFAEVARFLVGEMGPVLNKLRDEIVAQVREEIRNSIATANINTADVQAQIDALGGGGSGGGAHVAKAAGDIAKSKKGGKAKGGGSKAPKFPANGRLYAVYACTTDGAMTFVEKYAPDGDADAFIESVRADPKVSGHKNSNDEAWVMKQVGIALWNISDNKDGIRADFKRAKEDAQAATAAPPLKSDPAPAKPAAKKTPAKKPAAKAVDEDDTDFLGGAKDDDADDDADADNFDLDEELI